MKKFNKMGLVVIILAFTILFGACDLISGGGSGDSGSAKVIENTAELVTVSIVLQNKSKEVSFKDDGTVSLDDEGNVENSSDRGHWGIFAYVLDKNGSYVDTMEYYVDYGNYGDAGVAGDIWTDVGGSEVDGISSATLEVDPGWTDETNSDYIDADYTYSGTDYNFTWDGKNWGGGESVSGTYTLKLLVSRHTRTGPYYTEYEASIEIGGVESVENIFTLVGPDPDEGGVADSTVFPYNILESGAAVYTPITEQTVEDETKTFKLTVKAVSELLMADANVSNVKITIDGFKGELADVTAVKGTDSWNGLCEFDIIGEQSIDITLQALDSDGIVLHENHLERYSLGSENTQEVTISVFPIITNFAYTELSDSDRVYAVVAKDANNIYIGTRESGLGFSSDGGDNWVYYTKESDGLSSNRVSALTLSSDGTLYVGLTERGDDTNGSLAVLPSGGTSFTTYNLGYEGSEATETEEATSPGIDVNNILVIDSSLWYVATDNGIIKTTDGGTTWDVIDGDDGLPGRTYEGSTHNSDGTTTYSDVTSYAANGLFMNENRLWAALDGGLAYSDNGGSSWTTALAVERTLSIVLIDGKLVLATRENGIFFSSDNGSSWVNYTASDNGLSGDRVYGVISDSDEIWYVICRTGLSISVDDLGEWGGLKNLDSEPYELGRIYSFSQIGDVILLGTRSGLVSFTLP